MLGRWNCVGTDVDSIVVRTVLFTPIFALPFPWSHKMRPFLKSSTFNHSCLWITTWSKYDCIWLGKKFISFFIYSLDGFWGLNYIGLLSDPSVDLRYIRLFLDISMGLKYIRLLSDISTSLKYIWLFSHTSTGWKYIGLLSDSFTGLKYFAVLSDISTGLTYMGLLSNISTPGTWNTSDCSPTLLRAGNTSGCSLSDSFTGLKYFAVLSEISDL